MEFLTITICLGIVYTVLKLIDYDHRPDYTELNKLTEDEYADEYFRSSKNVKRNNK